MLCKELRRRSACSQCSWQDLRWKCTLHSFLPSLCAHHIKQEACPVGFPHGKTADGLCWHVQRPDSSETGERRSGGLGAHLSWEGPSGWHHLGLESCLGCSPGAGCLGTCDHNCESPLLPQCFSCASSALRAFFSLMSTLWGGLLHLLSRAVKQLAPVTQQMHGVPGTWASWGTYPGCVAL